MNIIATIMMVSKHVKGIDVRKCKKSDKRLLINREF